MDFQIVVNYSSNSKSFIARSPVEIEGETYSAHLSKDGKIRVVASDGWTSRYPMMTKTNKPIWDALVAALKE